MVLFNDSILTFFKITSDDEEDLKIAGKAEVKIRGNENVFLDSANLTMNAAGGMIMMQSEVGAE